MASYGNLSDKYATYNGTYFSELSVVTTTVFVTLFAVSIFLGVVCNSIVLMVYLQRMRNVKDDRSYIPVLGSVDLAICVLVSTQGLLETTFSGNILPLCTAFAFIGQLLHLASAFLVLSIAVQRHRKVCHPFVSHTNKPRLVQTLVAIIIVILPSPVIVFSVTREKDFVQCDRLGGIRPENGPALYLAFLAFVVVAGFIGTLFLYTNIEMEMKKRYRISKSIYQRHEENLMNKEIVDILLQDANLTNKSKSNRKVDREVAETSFTEIFPHKLSSKKVRFDAMDFSSPSAGRVQLTKITAINNDLGPSLSNEPEMTSIFNSTENILDGNCSVSESQSNTLEKRKKRKKHQTLKRRKSRLGRFTFMYIVIVIVYTLTTLPVLVVRVLDLVPWFDKYTNREINLILSFLSNSFIIRSVVNPFIYGCFDMKFRQNLMDLLCCCNK